MTAISLIINYDHHLKPIDPRAPRLYGQQKIYRPEEFLYALLFHLVSSNYKILTNT